MGAPGALACDRRSAMLARTCGSNFFSRLAAFSSRGGGVCSFSCGGPPPAAAPATPPPAAAPVVVAPPPDLAATPEPDGLIVFARAAKPNEALKVIGGWTQLPVPGSDQVGALVAGESVGNVVDLDQPLDFALTLHGSQPHGAISAGVRSLDEARVAFSKYKLVPVENGALHIEGLGKPDDADKDDADDAEARVCELVPSFGPATTRLICAESKGTLKELGPWLARSAPRLTFPADVHIELHLAPLRPVVAQVRRLLPMLVGSALGFRSSGIPEVEEAFAAAVGDLGDFTSDADTVAVDAMLGEPQGTVTLTAQFRSTTSLLARLAVAHPERADTPPASFWKLPADTDSAFFHRGMDAADFEHARDHVADVLGGVLGKGGMPDADRKALRDAASHMLDLLTRCGPIVRQGARRGVGRQGGRRDRGDEAGRRRRARRPCAWPRRKWPGGSSSAWMPPRLDSPRRRRSGPRRGRAPAWRSGRRRRRRTRRRRSSAWPRSPRGSPGRTRRIWRWSCTPGTRAARRSARERRTKGREAARGKPIVLHALVVPDGNASWLVFAADLERRRGQGERGAGDRSERARVAPRARVDEGRADERGGFVSARAFAVGDVFGWTLAPTPWRLHDAAHRGAGVVAGSWDDADSVSAGVAARRRGEPRGDVHGDGDDPEGGHRGDRADGDALRCTKRREPRPDIRRGGASA